MVVFTLAVVATPRDGVLGLRRVRPAGRRGGGAGPGRAAAGCCSRALIELPFVLFAFALPFLGGGERVEVARACRCPSTGLHGAWNILAKGTLGVLASLLLAATTTTRDLIARAGPAALPADPHPDRHVHAALPGRAGRRGAADAGGPALPRVTTRASCGSCAASPPGSARCSCAPSSGASGSTWRCCPAATRADARRVAGRGRGDRRPVAGRGDGAGGGGLHRRRRRRADMIGVVQTAVSLDVRGVRYAYPDGHVGPARGGPDRAARRAGGAARAQRRRQDHAGAAPQRHPHPDRRGA